MSEDTAAVTAQGRPPAVRESRNGVSALLGSAAGRNTGLVVALVLLCLGGVVTAGDRFADVDNILTILRLASVIGVVSVGMTFVITGGETVTW